MKGRTLHFFKSQLKAQYQQITNINISVTIFSFIPLCTHTHTHTMHRHEEHIHCWKDYVLTKFNIFIPNAPFKLSNLTHTHQRKHGILAGPSKSKPSVCDIHCPSTNKSLSSQELHTEQSAQETDTPNPIDFQKVESNYPLGTFPGR